ncbi:hypothetical protein, partial [Bacteroides heparinolyticus]|uniref:hypothetical protein n=1 Tax=Prevotella heparinolytica TaxID=28113 RepID=UPI0035A19681
RDGDAESKFSIRNSVKSHRYKELSIRLVQADNYSIRKRGDFSGNGKTVSGNRCGILRPAIVCVAHK